MNNGPHFCRDCDHVDPASRKKAQYHWLCLRHRRLEGQGFVDPDTWVENEPYLKCKDVNGGICELYSPRRDAGIAKVIKDSIPY